MNYLLKTELRKALRNRMLCLALIIGTVITLIPVWENAALVQRVTEIVLDSIEKNYSLAKNFDGCSLFVNWMSIKPNTQGGVMFFYCWPILAALPYGWSYQQERKSGAYYQIVARSNKCKYFLAKIISVFVSGGLAVGVPVLANLLANALICPYTVPQVIDYITPIFNGSFLSALYYTHPWLHGLAWSFIAFLWGGTAACLCLGVGVWLRHEVMVMLVPFATLTLMDSLVVTLQKSYVLRYECSPMKLIYATTIYPNPGWVIFGVMGVLLTVSVLLGYWQVVRHELA